MNNSHDNCIPLTDKHAYAFSESGKFKAFDALFESGCEVSNAAIEAILDGVLANGSSYSDLERGGSTELWTPKHGTILICFECHDFLFE